MNRSPLHYRQAAEDPRLDPADLHELAASPVAFIRLTVLSRPWTAPETLLRVVNSEFDAWDTNRMLRTAAEHVRADRTVLLRVLERVAALLAGSVERPYAAALALADRPELDPDELRPLVNLPGASRRFRSQFLAKLAARRAARP
ncbi:hypothetical protein [Dactylosporangium salmoneum]|uniref:Uncharacterized protein n=1 Tax=Dactylosporangium salmoneum TaxID=53361 RepID=A0ABP5SWV6_9ACTN